MKGIYSALIAAMLLAPSGAALAAGTATGDQSGTTMQGGDELPGGSSDMSTQTGSANTEAGDTEVKGGSTQSPTADDQPIPEGEQMDPNSGVDSAQDVDPENPSMAGDQPIPEGEQMDPNSGVDSAQDVEPGM